MKYVAGIDGGQTATQAAIADERGRVLGMGSAGPSDEIGQDAGSTRLHDALSGALEAARRDAGLPGDATFEAIVAGVSGYEGRLYGESPALPTRRFDLMHDPAIAHAGAFEGSSGVVVIAGTGSIAYVVDDDGATGMRGGLGYVFGDEGSAFWIAKSALAAAASHAPPCAVASAAAAHFRIDSMRDIFAAFYHGRLDRERLASFARTVLEISDRRAGDGLDPCAFATVAAAHEHLAELACWASFAPWRWNDRPRAAFVGGLMANAPFKAAVYRAVATRASRMRVVEPKHPPVLGALLLALRKAHLADRLAT